MHNILEHGSHPPHNGSIQSYISFTLSLSLSAARRLCISMPWNRYETQETWLCKWKILHFPLIRIPMLYGFIIEKCHRISDEEIRFRRYYFNGFALFHFIFRLEEHINKSHFSWYTRKQVHINRCCFTFSLNGTSFYSSPLTSWKRGLFIIIRHSFISSFGCTIWFVVVLAAGSTSLFVEHVEPKTDGRPSWKCKEGMTKERERKRLFFGIKSLLSF